MVKVKEKSELITINAGENLKKLISKNFVHPTKHSIFLPYFDELEEEADKNFQFIVNGMVAAFLTENAIEAGEYTDMFIKHLRLFGLRMSKETFLNLVRFFYEILIKKDQNRSLMKTACYGFGKMMKLNKNGRFGWRDLTLDWKPIYDLFLKALNNKIKPDISSNLNDVIQSFAIFYHPEEHLNIWETLLQEIVIGSHLFMEQFMTICRLFLSVEGMTEEDVKKYANDTWINPLWDLYSKADMNTLWTSVCMEHIAESLAHFQRLMQYIQVNVHPLNAGDHTEQIGSFLKEFMSQFKFRLKEERLKYRKRQCPSQFYLTDKDIDAVTESVTNLAVMLMFSINFQNDYKLIHGLTTVNREYVAPKLLDHLYSSLTAVSEPQRLTVIIEAFSVIIFEVIRQPDSEYRMPRDISYDSTWLIFLEEERKNWQSYKIGSEVLEVKTHRFTSLRAHAFYIMEIFVNQINVSDVDRTAFIFRTLISLFSSFPLMDFSSSVQFHGTKMSEDDRILCLLSKRIPHIVEFMIEKILEVITCLSVVAPKTSGGEAGASISNESQKQVGDEETVLKLGISQLVKVIFERVDEKMRKILFDRLFSYLTTAEFASNLASETLSSLVVSAIWVSPDAFRHYAEFISDKLKSLITRDVQKARNPTSSILFYVELTRPFFAATHQMILENENILMEIIDLLLQCENTNIHKCGTFGVSTLLSILLSIDTELAASPENEILAKPLTEWNPIEFWAKCYNFKETVIKWFIPAIPEIECAQRIVNRFFFPFVKDLAEKEHNRLVDPLVINLFSYSSTYSETIRRFLNHISTILQDIELFEHPDSIRLISDVYTPFCLPIPSSSLGKSCMIEHQLKGPNGENAKEMILKMIEKVSKTIHDPISLVHVSSIAFRCLGKRKLNQFDTEIESLLIGAYGVLVDSTHGTATKTSQHTVDQMAFIKHAQIQAYHNHEIRHPNDFDERILQLLFDLALNDYEKVRSTAIAFLKENKNQLFRFRHIFIPKVMKVLIEEHKNMDRLAGAMNIILELGWLKDVNPKIRIVVWDAVLRLKVFDDLKICILFEEICKEISSMKKEVTHRPWKRETHDERNRRISEISKQLTKQNDFWKPFLSDESLKKQTDIWFNRANSRHSLRGNLVEMLYKNHVGNKKLHHTRENLAKTMTFHAQKEVCDDRTIALMLSQLNDEQYNCRNEAREWLSHWLYENKPKTVRVDMKSPKRVDHGIALESGIREDNLWLAYDSENLPNAEDKWNDTVFIDKEKGSCRWPKTLNVVRKRNEGAPLLLERMTYSDRLLINYFSQPGFVLSVLSSRVIEKEDHVLPNRNFWNIFKYVIRNYPDEKKPLEVFTNSLKQLMKSKNRNEQLLAAELFIGIAVGLKHRPFGELDAFWRDITVCLNDFFHIMVLDAEPAWSLAISFVLSGDLRRNWWLLESLIDGARKSSGQSEFQQSFRLVSLIFKRWRHGEIMKRVSTIAWNKLETAVTDSVRIAVGSVFCATAQICEKNSSATLINIPKRFIPDSLDVTIQKIIEKVFSLIYFRTLLETIIQYYDISMQSWSPSLVKILPKLMEYANEDDYDVSEETYRDVDITQNSALIIHDYMSASWLRSEFVDSIANSWLKTFISNCDSSRVRLAVIKFVQASVYSNMFPMSINSRKEKVESLIFKAILDREISVRKEAAKCLLLLINCEYLTISDQKVDEFSRILHSKTESEADSHGAALALGALTLAYPFSLPQNILKPLRILSSTTSNKAVVQQTMTETVREFRRQHRDDWTKTKQILGEQLVYDIENATAPSYYA
uniref:BLM10_mid domain-containing protein n=1 Tax=Caenorhabditis tropicalis TaxID=1561998 RepID=A0A1I7ULD2_9PELO